jgi:flagellar biosynthesis/type III secretory pathway protein FliH
MGLRSGQFRGQKGLGPLKKPQKMPHYMFCPRQKKIIISMTFKIRGTLVFLCPKERERERVKERERESKSKSESENKSESERKCESESGKGKGKEKGRRKGTGKGTGKGTRKGARKGKGERESRSRWRFYF